MWIRVSGAWLQKRSLNFQGNDAHASCGARGEACAIASRTERHPGTWCVTTAHMRVAEGPPAGDRKASVPHGMKEDFARQDAGTWELGWGSARELGERVQARLRVRGCQAWQSRGRDSASSETPCVCVYSMHMRMLLQD